MTARCVPGCHPQGAGHSFPSPGPGGARKRRPDPGPLRGLLPPFTTYAPPSLVGPVDRQGRSWKPQTHHEAPDYLKKPENTP